MKISLLRRIFFFLILSAIPVLGFAAENNSAPKPDQLVEQGIEAVKKNDLKQAQDLFRRAKQLNPEFAPAYVGEAQVLTLQNAWDEALVLLNRAIQLNPGYGTAFYNRGVLHYYRGEFMPAFTDLQRARELGENIEEDLFYQVWGAAYPDEIIRRMDEEIKKTPNTGELYYNRAMANMHKKDTAAARKDFQKAQELGVTVEPIVWSELEKQGEMTKSLNASLR